MTTTPVVPAFGRGGDAAAEADEVLSASRKGGQFRRTEYLPNPGKGKSIVLRYITEADDWIYALAHTGVPTKNAPSDFPADKKWPETMGAVCRYDKAFAGIYSDCYIDDAHLKNKWGRECKPTVRVWALATIREEVIATPEIIAKHGLDANLLGKRVGFKDATREVAVLDSDGKPTDEKTIEPRIVLVNKAVGNYFQGLNSMKTVYGTVCDRDYLVTQHDEAKDVTFTHTPFDPDGLKPGTDNWKRYEQAIVDQDLDLVKIVSRQAEDEYFARFFDPNKEAAPRATGNESAPGQQSSAPAAQQSAAPNNDASADQIRAMRDRVRGVVSTGSAQPTPAADPAPAATAATQSTGGIDFSA